MPKFTSHIFVCCNRREPGHDRGCCDPDGAERLRNAFKAELNRRGLGPLVRANKSGCLDQCEHGPTVVIYPQQIWYGHVTVADVPRIVEETIVHGRVLPDLVIAECCLNTRPCPCAPGPRGAASQSATS
jgi:(2Fe-2S) ferredoxin